MDDETMTKVIAHYMPGACDGNNCPAPEIWAAVVSDDLPASEREKLERHASDCRYCAAERALAQRFIDMPQSAEDADVAWIVNEVRKRNTESAGNVVELRPRRRYLLPGLLGLAAAAMLVLAFAPMLPLMQPALDVPVADDITRGSRITPVTPVGEVADAPLQLQWSAAAEASRYRVTISDVAGDIIWTAYSDGPAMLPIPAEVLERLQPAVVYKWAVVGQNEAGETTAQSTPTSFRVKP